MVCPSKLGFWIPDTSNPEIQTGAASLRDGEEYLVVPVSCKSQYAGLSNDGIPARDQRCRVFALARRKILPWKHGVPVGLMIRIADEERDHAMLGYGLLYFISGLISGVAGAEYIVTPREPDGAPARPMGERPPEMVELVNTRTLGQRSWR
jgi:hypothetical protein